MIGNIQDSIGKLVQERVQETRNFPPVEILMFSGALANAIMTTCKLPDNLNKLNFLIKYGHYFLRLE